MAARAAEEARGSMVAGGRWIQEVGRRMDEMAAQRCLIGNSVGWVVGERRAAERRKEAWAEEAEEAEEEVAELQAGLFDVVNWAAEGRDAWEEERAEDGRLRRRLRAAVRAAEARSAASEKAEEAAVERAAETERRAEAAERAAEADAVRRLQVVATNWKQTYYY